MFDIGGTFSYSPVIVLQKKENTNVVIVYPNPARNENVTVSVTSQSKYNAELKVFDATGKFLWRQIQVINKGFNTIALPSVAQFSTGIYTLQLKAEHKVITKQFAVVK